MCASNMTHSLNGLLKKNMRMPPWRFWNWILKPNHIGIGFNFCFLSMVINKFMSCPTLSLCGKIKTKILYLDSRKYCSIFFFQHDPTFWTVSQTNQTIVCALLDISKLNHVYRNNFQSILSFNYQLKNWFHTLPLIIFKVPAWNTFFIFIVPAWTLACIFKTESHLN